MCDNSPANKKTDINELIIECDHPERKLTLSVKLETNTKHGYEIDYKELVISRCKVDMIINEAINAYERALATREQGKAFEHRVALKSAVEFIRHAFKTEHEKSSTSPSCAITLPAATPAPIDPNHLSWFLSELSARAADPDFDDARIFEVTADGNGFHMVNIHELAVTAANRIEELEFALGLYIEQAEIINKLIGDFEFKGTNSAAALMLIKTALELKINK